MSSELDLEHYYWAIIANSDWAFGKI